MAETTTQTVLEVDSHLRERTNRQQNARQQEANNWVTREHHGRGETAQQHAAHASTKHKQHFGLSLQNDEILFWCIAIPSWVLQIAAAITGSLLRTSSHAFIATMTPHFILHWAAWLQTAIGMTRRASWVRDEGDLVERTEFLVLAVRLNRLMMPTAVISLAVFIQAYARRHSTDDLAYWLLFLLSFIWNIVFSVMNAYNNISWENDRLNEEGEVVYNRTFLAILGIAS